MVGNKKIKDIVNTTLGLPTHISEDDDIADRVSKTTSLSIGSITPTEVIEREQDYRYFYREHLDTADDLSKIRCETGEHEWKTYHNKYMTIERCKFRCGMLRKRLETFFWKAYETLVATAPEWVTHTGGS